MTPKELMQDLAGGKIYLFAGPEDYLKRHTLAEVQKKLVPDDAFAAFNFLRFHGETPDFERLVDALSSPPMMAEAKLVVWEHVDFSSMGERERDRVIEGIASLSAAMDPETVLIFLAGSEGLDLGTERRRSPIYRKLEKVLCVVEFDLADERRLIPWIGRHFAQCGVTSTPEVCAHLIALCGRSMTILANETDKIAFYVLERGRNAVTLADVDNAASPIRESEAFALTNALLDRDRSAAFAALLDLKERRVDAAVAVGALCRFYSELLTVAAFGGTAASEVSRITKMNEYKLKLYQKAVRRVSLEQIRREADRCRAIDEATKGMAVGVGGYTAIERFIASVL